MDKLFYCVVNCIGVEWREFVWTSADAWCQAAAAPWPRRNYGPGNVRRGTVGPAVAEGEQ